GRPCLAIRADAVEPAGPPPITTTSVSRGRVIDIAVPKYGARARPGDLKGDNNRLEDSCPDNYCRNDVMPVVGPAAVSPTRKRGRWGRKTTAEARAETERYRRRSLACASG